MNNNDQRFMAEKIRSEYIEKKSTQLDALRMLDAKVRRPARVFAGFFGTMSALVMGSGMSLAMTDLGQTLRIPNPMGIGIAVGLVGIVMAALTYPIFLKILSRRRKRYAPEIMELSDKILRQ